MKAIDRLRALYLADQKERHPNVPEYALPKYKRTPKDTNGLTASDYRLGEP